MRGSVGVMFELMSKMKLQFQNYGNNLSRDIRIRSDARVRDKNASTGDRDNDNVLEFIFCPQPFMSTHSFVLQQPVKGRQVHSVL